MIEWFETAIDFSNILNISITASWLILVVIGLRLVLKKAPKWVNVALWGIVALRLLMPFSIESSLSLVPSVETVSDQLLQAEPEYSHEDAQLDIITNPNYGSVVTMDLDDSMDTFQWSMVKMSLVWYAGIAAMSFYTLISFIILRRKLRTAVILRDNLFQCETVSSPFVLGILKPKIYLPYVMDDQNLNHVIAHEQAHIRRKDHWWKPLGFLLLTIHWFNPLMWVAYILLCRDIELACDEKVIAELGNEQRADYTQALVACAVNRRMIAACPLAFGEVGVKERVKSVMNYKKPTFWIIIAALVVCVVVAVCFLTDPFEPVLNDILFQNGYYVISENEREVTLSVPKASLSDEIYTSEGYEFDEGEVVAYQTDSSTVYLRKVMLSNESVDQLYFAFDISYDFADGGTILSIYSRVPGDQITFYGGLRSKDLRDSNTVYPDTVKTRGHGPDSQFWFYVSADACKNANEVLQFDVVFNEIEYEADQRNRSFSMSGNNVSDLNPAGIVERILKAEGWKSSNVYVNADNFDLHVDADFNWMDSQAVRYFFSNAKKTYSSQLRIFPDKDQYFLTERTEWHEQEQKFLLQYYLEAIKYLPQDAIREMAPADKYIIQHIEEGRPSDFNRVITYSSEGVEDTDGWYIHLQIMPLHADGGTYSGTGDEVLDVFYGESYGSVAAPDNIAFGLYDLEGENAEITEVKLRNLHNGKDTVITDPADIQSIAEFFTKVQGANRTSSKGYYGGSYEVQLCNGSRTVLSIGFGDDDSFNCGDYGDGYPARYELWGVTREDVIRFFSQYDSSDFDWGLPMVLNAKLLEIHDGYFIVEPVEGSWELSSASQIEVPMKNMAPSPEPEVGDVLLIEYDGQLEETYPARITNPLHISVLVEVQTSEILTGFEFNFAGNTSGGQKMELTEDKPYWRITVVNEGTNGIKIDILGTIYMVDAGTTGHIYPDKAWDPGTYSVFIGTAGGIGMEGYAICSISSAPFQEEEPLAKKVSSAERLSDHPLVAYISSEWAVDKKPENVELPFNHLLIKEDGSGSIDGVDVTWDICEKYTSKHGLHIELWDDNEYVVSVVYWRDSQLLQIVDQNDNLLECYYHRIAYATG